MNSEPPEAPAEVLAVLAVLAAEREITRMLHTDGLRTREDLSYARG